MRAHMLDHLNMTVRDVDESADWYARVLGFEPVEGGVQGGRRWKILQSGEALLCIYEHPERRDPDIDTHVHHGVSHFGLRITDREAWEQTVTRENVEISYGGPVEWPRSISWYVTDPNGYEIEVALWNDGRASF